METETGKWIAQLILTHLDGLATEVTAEARQRVNLYAGMSADQVKPLFVHSYQVQAETFAKGDMEPLREYMRPTITARIQSGATAAELINLVTVLHDGLRRLIRQHGSDNPARQADAMRQVDSVNQNLRLLFSEINLQVLMQRRNKSG